MIRVNFHLICVHSLCSVIVLFLGLLSAFGILTPPFPGSSAFGENQFAVLIFLPTVLNLRTISFTKLKVKSSRRLSAQSNQ